jgi:futalosine hydrolase
MNILIVSATELEVKPLLNFLEINSPLNGLNHSNIKVNGHDIKLLITGVGMVNTALMMGRYMNSLYDLTINVGICGSFDRNLNLGQVVQVEEDILSEMGAENGEEFLTYEQLNLPGTHVYRAITNQTYLAIELLNKVKGVTVNTVHGNDISIDKVKKRYSPDVESMEGASFFAGCERVGGDCLQIRAISNYVERRDKSKWQIPLAIQNLNEFLIKFVSEL